MDSRQGVQQIMTVDDNRPLNSMPAIPDLLRRFGREGVMIVRLLNQSGYTHAVIVPEGVHLICWCGWMSQSEGTFYDHMVKHPSCLAAHQLGSMDVHIRRGETPTYQVLPISQEFVNWANEQFQGNNVRECDGPEGANYGFAGIFDPNNMFHRPVVDENQHRHVVEIPNELRRSGVSGVLPVTIPGMGNPGVPTSGVVMPPGVAIYRWCGMRSGNFSVLATEHRRCNTCSARHAAPALVQPGIFPVNRGQLVPVVSGFSVELANWANEVVAMEAEHRARGGGYPAALANVPRRPPMDPNAGAAWTANNVAQEALRQQQEQHVRQQAQQARAQEQQDLANERAERQRLSGEVGRLNKELDERKKRMNDLHQNNVRLARENATHRSRKSMSVNEAMATPANVTPDTAVNVEVNYPIGWSNMSEEDRSAWVSEEIARKFRTRKLDMGKRKRGSK